MKQFFLQLFATKIGWLLISIILIITFGILSNWYYWAQFALGISCIYPLGLCLVMIAYAWIINPIREWRKK